MNSPWLLGIITSVIAAAVYSVLCLHLLPRIKNWIARIIDWLGLKRRYPLQASATQLLKERLQSLIKNLEKNPIEDAIHVEEFISMAFEERKQLLQPIRAFFLRVLQEAKKNRLRSTRASVLDAARQFLISIKRAHKQINNRHGGLPQPHHSL
jgi:glycyl-tRNA synthetase beta subunit